MFWENRKVIWDDCYENAELEPQLRKRFFPYTTSIPHLNQAFENALKPSILELAREKRSQYDDAIATYVGKNNYLLSIERLIDLENLHQMRMSDMNLQSLRCNVKRRHRKIGQNMQKFAAQ